MFICALFSASYGWWNEQMTRDQGFVTALKHIVQGQCARHACILEVRPDAIFIQSESSEYFHAENPKAIGPAEFMNARRFLSLDLNYGRRVESGMYEYLMDNGMTRDEYHFFLADHPAPSLHHGERLLRHQRAPGQGGRAPRAAGDVFGYDEITRQYYDSYRLPVMHTETNLSRARTGTRR